ncbi:MAG: 2-oxoacid:acceptor oxidoreductase family protein [Chloroflexota bacterium]
MRKEIRISGFGGQGVVLAGYILGKALSLYDELEAVMTQAYGPEARGGASSSNIVFSDRPIAYPFVQHADVLVALSQEAYTRFRPQARPGALILTDEDLVTPLDGDHPLTIPATRLAEELGKRMVANVIMLGFFTAVTGLVSRQGMQAAIQNSVKERLVSLNLQAFTTGYDYSVERYGAASPLVIGAAGEADSD